MRYNTGAGLRVDMVVITHPTLFPWPRCGNATVDLVISGTAKFWEQHDGLGPSVLTKLAVGWDGSTRITPPPGVMLSPQERGSPALVAFFAGEPQASLHPGFYTNADLTHNSAAHQNSTVGFPSNRPVGLVTRTFNWGGTPGDPHQYAVHLHFVANWVTTRGFGSCYVLLPSLLANGAFAGTQNALDALGLPLNKVEGEAQPPSFGRIALATPGSLSLPDTSPAPTDVEPIFVGRGGDFTQRATELAAKSGGTLGPVWACQPSDDLSYLYAVAPGNIPPPGSFTGDACGALAVINAPGASDFRATVLIVFGVLIALAFEWLVRRKRDPLGRSGAEAGDAPGSGGPTVEGGGTGGSLARRDGDPPPAPLEM
jgi:hypothetical protein